MRSPRRESTGFTLVELTLAMAIMTILIGAMTSVVLIASHALPDADDPAMRSAEAIAGAELIVSDLITATTLTEASAGAVEFIVADRGHDPDGPETIRYAWSGTPGDPLTRQYNGGDAVTICADVQDFSLAYARTARPLNHSPRVLLVVGDDPAPSADDLARSNVIESWGFRVVMIDPYAGDAAYASALASTDVMYWTEEHTVPPPAWVFDASRGIVCEERDRFFALGLSTGSNWNWTSTLDIIDNTHEITSVFPLGSIEMLSTADYVIFVSNTIAPGGTILGRRDGYDMLFAVDVGGLLHDGREAPARRVAMPWGDRTFGFDLVTDDGRTLMRRAIAWAAAPVGVSGVTITLHVGNDTSGRVETQTQLLNLPEIK